MYKNKIIERAKAIILPLIAIILALVIWQVVIIVNNIPEWQMPRPTEIFKTMFGSFQDIKGSLFYTYSNIFIGFVIAVILGVFLAAIINSNKLAGITLTPYINLLCTIPLITIVPLLMLWMGLGRNVKILTVVIQSFPIMNLNACVAFANTDPMRLELMSSLKASKVKKFFYCILPDSVSGVFTGVKLAAILSILAEVSAEMTGGNKGLGAFINNSVAYMKMSEAFASIFYIAIFGFVLYYIITFIENKLMKNR